MNTVQFHTYSEINDTDTTYLSAYSPVFCGNTGDGDWVGTVHYYCDCVWHNNYTTGVEDETTS